MPERPRMYLDTKSTSSTDYVDLLSVEIARDAKGVSYFSLSIDPDPNARYRIIVGSLLSLHDMEITAVWTMLLPHLTSGGYSGFKAGDHIVVKHRSTDGAITVKTGLTLAFNEVVNWCARLNPNPSA